MTAEIANICILIIFILGYLAIIFEHNTKINKTAVALFIAVVTWMFYFLTKSVPISENYAELGHHLSDVSQILFFLVGAMTIVELIDTHKGFNVIVRLINTRSRRMILLVVAILSFFLSSVLDNLTTSILMASILRKLVHERKERFMLCCMVIIAANAGGAWTPIGDVTTTMLWINGQVSSIAVMRDLFIPSLVCMLVPLLIYMIPLKGKYPPTAIDYHNEPTEPGSTLILVLGILALIAVPVIKWLTGLPPFMGMIIGLSVLWMVTDILHFKHEDRHYLRVPSVLTKIDVSSILFFLGILLSVDSLQAVGFLQHVATFLNEHVNSVVEIATAIGLFSAIIDNVPLVAATIGNV